MIDDVMVVHASHFLITAVLVCVQCGGWINIVNDNGFQCLGVGLFDNKCLDPTIAGNCADDWCFANRTAARFSFLGIFRD